MIYFTKLATNASELHDNIPYMQSYLDLRERPN